MKNEPIDNKQLAIAEAAIDKLAAALDISEKEIVDIFKTGIMEDKGRQFDPKLLYFLDEMIATYDCY